MTRPRPGTKGSSPCLILLSPYLDLIRFCHPPALRVPAPFIPPPQSRCSPLLLFFSPGALCTPNTESCTADFVTGAYCAEPLIFVACSPVFGVSSLTAGCRLNFTLPTARELQMAACMYIHTSVRARCKRQRGSQSPACKLRCNFAEHVIPPVILAQMQGLSDDFAVRYIASTEMSKAASLFRIHDTPSMIPPDQTSIPPGSALTLCRVSQMHNPIISKEHHSVQDAS